MNDDQFDNWIVALGALGATAIGAAIASIWNNQQQEQRTTNHPHQPPRIKSSAELAQELETLLHTDPLSASANSRFADTLLHYEIARRLEQGQSVSQADVALLMLEYSSLYPDAEERRNQAFSTLMRIMQQQLPADATSEPAPQPHSPSQPSPAISREQLWAKRNHYLYILEGLRQQEQRQQHWYDQARQEATLEQLRNAVSPPGYRDYSAFSYLRRQNPVQIKWLLHDTRQKIQQLERDIRAIDSQLWQ